MSTKHANENNNETSCWAGECKEVVVYICKVRIAYLIAATNTYIKIMESLFCQSKSSGF